MATTGELLKNAFGISKFKHIYIQKIIDMPQNVYVITINSRFPDIHIPINKINKLKSNKFQKLRVTPGNIQAKSFKLTPPINLNDFVGRITSNAIIIFRDIAGELYMNKNLYD